MVRPKRAVLTLEEDLKGSPFLKCVASISWALPVRGEGVLGLARMGWDTFFSILKKVKMALIKGRNKRLAFCKNPAIVYKCTNRFLTKDSKVA